VAAVDTDLGFKLGDGELDQLAAAIRSRLRETGKERPGA
jgi:hypothetical protein